LGGLGGGHHGVGTAAAVPEGAAADAVGPAQVDLPQLPLAAPAPAAARGESAAAARGRFTAAAREKSVADVRRKLTHRGRRGGVGRQDCGRRGRCPGEFVSNSREGKRSANKSLPLWSHRVRRRQRALAEARSIGASPFCLCVCVCVCVCHCLCLSLREGGARSIAPSKHPEGCLPPAPHASPTSLPAKRSTILPTSFYVTPQASKSLPASASCGGRATMCLC
jgi:hypothetical protein